ncbi:helix-turn-helix domain-containing protein [Enterococcus sp. AZ062]|uniref:helix-turn-helix domain-containing protein n=1 Tax=Enterococcus sp. AZ062 TaxID=2774692 RepID=UPI003F257DCF
MQTLFHQLIFTTKTKRWLILLATLEEEEHVIAQNLIEQTGFGRRTILEDLKAIKVYFSDSIQLIGDGKGYHFSFLDPKGYYRMKQALLDEEKLFLFVDQLASGKCLDNQQWVASLGISNTGFQRMKRQFQTVLTKHYGIKLRSKTNQLSGKEAGIRQFLYDFYFTLPLYPTVLQEHIRSLHQGKATFKEGPWHLDPTLFNQWLKLIQLRIDQGYFLPDQGIHRDLQTALVQALDQQVNLALPDPEKAALFLLSLDENQFLTPSTQRAFIQTFSPTKEPYRLVREPEGLAYQLFDTLLCLMERFFQLPPLEEEIQESRKKDVLLATFMRQFSAQKKRYSNTIAVSYDLTGPSALKHWIKTEVEATGNERGLHFIDAPLANHLGVLRQIRVTNQAQQLNSTGEIQLPTFPTKEVIQRVLSGYS